jgi:hypothetical protein
MEQVNLVEQEAPEESTMVLYNDDNRGCLEVKKMISDALTTGLGEGAGAGILDAPLDSQDIEAVLIAANEGIREFNRIETVGNGVSAGYAVRNGNTLNILRNQVKAQGDSWTDFVADNIVGMSQRTVDKHISISKIPGVQGHLALGIERLNILAGAISGFNSSDPIAQLFSKHNLPFSPTMEIPFDKFKLVLERVTLQEKVARQGLELDEKVAKKIVDRDVTISAADLVTAKEIKEAGGQEAKFFEKKLASATKANTTPKSNKNTTSPPKKVKSFNKAAVQLKDVIKAATTTTDAAILRDIDASMIDDLLADLEALKAHLIKH